jgi:hypothetical protein
MPFIIISVLSSSHRGKLRQAGLLGTVYLSDPGNSNLNTAVESVYELDSSMG